MGRASVVGAHGRGEGGGGKNFGVCDTATKKKQTGVTPRPNTPQKKTHVVVSHCALCFRIKPAHNQKISLSLLKVNNLSNQYKKQAPKPDHNQNLTPLLALPASPGSGPPRSTSRPASSPLLCNILFPHCGPASSLTPPSHTSSPPIPLGSPRRGPRSPSTTRPSSTSSTFKPPTCATSATSSSVRHFFLRPREGGVVTATSRYSIKQRTN